MAETVSAPANNAPSNQTRASITGKVPDFAKPRHHRGRKSAKLSGHRKAHAKHLMKAGAISPKAAASHGIATAGSK